LANAAAGRVLSISCIQYTRFYTACIRKAGFRLGGAHLLTRPGACAGRPMILVAAAPAFWISRRLFVPPGVRDFYQPGYDPAMALGRDRRWDDDVLGVTSLTSPQISVSPLSIYVRYASGWCFISLSWYTSVRPQAT
jgi:hypothetical protein